jgi:hypothetical protein
MKQKIQNKIKKKEIRKYSKRENIELKGGEGEC